MSALVKLKCKKCGSEKEIFRSQLGLRYHHKKGQYKCRHCWNSIRKGKRVNPVVAKMVSIKCIDCGFIRNVREKSDTAKTTRCVKCYRKAQKLKLVKCRPTVRVTISCQDCGKERTVKKSQGLRTGLYCISCKNSGERNPQWLGGLSNDPYPKIWGEKLRRFIRERDRHVCQICLKKCNKWLDAHHIDYDKNNCDEINLISLCHSCHTKTNGNRKHWEEYLSNLMCMEMAA